MIDITQETLKSLIVYEPETGLFRWRHGRNGAAAGKIAGSPDKDGYVRIRVNYKRYPAHRLAFLYMTGEWPREQVDHANLNKNDNRWENLRDATASQNAANRCVRGGKSILKGVYADGRKWKATIRKDGQLHYLGLYDSQEEANQAYALAASVLHGEFARA
jgi:hypothetical protein